MYDLVITLVENMVGFLVVHNEFGLNVILLALNKFTHHQMHEAPIVILRSILLYLRLDCVETILQQLAELAVADDNLA